MATPTRLASMSPAVTSRPGEKNWASSRAIAPNATPTISRRPNLQPIAPTTVSVAKAKAWLKYCVMPSIASTLVVVMTTMVITVLKVFDIVWVLTNGETGTEVIAERMIRWFFRNGHNGRGAAIAVVLFVAIIPVMAINVRRFKAEEEIR